MLHLRTVVVALDFSPGSEAALLRAADLAERVGATLHLLHADVLFRSSGDGAPPDGAPSSTLRMRVERFAADILGLPGSAALDGIGPTVGVVRDVTAPAAILRYASSVEADLLVLGTHGRSGASRLLLGSVAEAVVASAPCPVLTVPTRSEGPPPSGDAPVLVAVDFSAQSRTALTAGCALAESYGAPVELVHVVHDAGPYPGFAPNILSLCDFDPQRGDTVRERVLRFAEGTPCPRPAAVHVALGTPARLISQLAAERRARAVVLGTHGRTGLAHALIGSVSEATLRKAPCPVLTIKAAERLGVPRPGRSVLAH